MKKIPVAGLFFDPVTLEGAAQRMEEGIEEARRAPRNGTLQVLVANQDIINNFSARRATGVSALNSCFLTVADGISIVLAARLLGVRLPERVPGPDLMTRFLEISERKGYSHFFLGSTPRVCAALLAASVRRHPRIDIRGAYPPPRYPFSDAENRRIIAMVNRSGADVLWVSLGCPRQEEWILRFRRDIHVPVTAGVGAAFDFLSETATRAPLFLRAMHLEWFYRLCREPLRLSSRYIVGAFRFASHVMEWGTRPARGGGTICGPA